MKTPILAAVIVLVPFFILTSYSLYLHAMLILISIDAEYIQNVGFSFKKAQVDKITPLQIPKIC